MFAPGKLQQSDTIVMKDTMPSGVKDKSRSYYNTTANSTQEFAFNLDGTILSQENGRKPGQKNRTHTVCPEVNNRCNVQFKVFCDSKTKNWYLSAPSTKLESVGVCFHNHFRVLSSHITTQTKVISDEVKGFITSSLKSGNSIRSIIDLCRDHFHITLSPRQVEEMRFDYIDNMIELLEGEEKSDVAKMNAAQKLIRLFESMDDVSFVYVKHHIHSGFVTYTKSRGSTTTTNNFSKDDNRSLAQEIEIDSWRQSLGLDDNENILVSFAWGFDCELCKLRMYPEFIAVDGTFGMNKQKRTLH